ncbi:V-type ATPase subunit [bacterium]|nr:V-type ATPase subunit [bacterium]
MNILSVSSRIKSLEKHFLRADRIEKLVLSRDFNEFSTILEKSPYEIPNNIKTIETLTELFNNKKTILIEESKKNLPIPLYQYFVLKYDYHNLNIVANGKNENFSDYSIVNYKILQASFKTNNHKNIPAFLKPALSILNKLKDKSFEEISLSLKQSYYEVAGLLLKTQKSSMINYFLQIEIDFSNISLFMHKRLTGKHLEQENFIDGGNIKKEHFLKEEVLWKTVKNVYKNIDVPIEIDIFDRERFKVLMGYLSRVRIVPYGMEPLFFYFLARDIELENVKRIAIGKFYNIEPQILSEWGAFPYQYV